MLMRFAKHEDSRPLEVSLQLEPTLGSRSNEHSMGVVNGCR